MDIIYYPLWQAFDRLSQARGYGINLPNPLAVSEILTYAKAFEPWPFLDDFLEIIQAVDRDFLGRMAARNRDSMKRVAKQGQ